MSDRSKSKISFSRGVHQEVLTPLLSQLNENGSTYHQYVLQCMFIEVVCLSGNFCVGDWGRNSQKFHEVQKKMFGEWRRIFHIITIVSKLAGEWRRNLHKGDMTRFPFLYAFYDDFFSRILKKEEKYVNRLFRRLLFVIRFSNMM